MDKTVKVLKNTFYLLIAYILKPFISFFLVIYLSRMLGAGGLGEYDTVLAFMFFFETFASLGLNHLIVRGIAVDKSQGDDYFGAVTLIGVVAASAAILILFLILKVMNYPPEIALAIKVLSFSLFFSVLNVFWQSFFEGFQVMEFNSLAAITEVIGRVALGVLALYLGYGVLGIIWSIVIARFFVSILSIFLLLKLGIRPKWRVDLTLCRTLLKQTTTFLMIAFVTTTYWKIDIVMLSKMKGMVDVGHYTAAYRLIEILKELSFTYIIALFPLLSSSFSISKDAFKRNCIMSVRYLFMLTFPISIGASILAENIILLIYGENFVDSVVVLRLLIWSICFFPIALVFAKALVASHNQKIDLIINVLAMLFNITLNYILIPRFSFVGAAVATLVSLLFYVIIQYIFVSRTLFRVNLFKGLLKPFWAGCIMGVFTFYMSNLNLLLVIPLSAGFYILILFSIKTFSEKEISMFREIWNRKTGLLVGRG